MVEGSAKDGGRRAMLGGCAALAASMLAPGSALARPSRLRPVTLRSKNNPKHVALVLVPRKTAEGHRYPACLFLHGFAEASEEKRSLEAWPSGYGLTLASAELESPPIAPANGPRPARTAARATEITSALSRRAYRDVVLICPRTPVPYQLGRKQLGAYADWLTAELPELVSAVAPLEEGRCGLAGFSMGGRVALEVLQRKPTSFSSVSLIQAEFLKGQEAYYANRVVKSAGSGDKPRVQVLTASGDPYKLRSEGFARILKRGGFPVDLQLRRGRHSAAWMKELGSLETLFWQERTLATTG